MKFTHISYTIIISFFILLFSNCTKKTQDPEPLKTSTLTLHFDNVAGNSDFAFNTDYTNAAGNTFKVNLLKYFITNIKLQKSDGSVFVIPQDKSYFLVDEAIETSQDVTLDGVPEGDYVGATFMIGVDSLRSTKDASQRTGNLDVTTTAAGMYWSWNSGYIFFKMEGTSPAVTSTDNAFRYHIGGFGGMTTAATNNIRTRTITFGTDKAMVRQGKTPEVHLMVNVLGVFNGTTNFNLATSGQSTIMGGANSSLVANNYVNIFTYDHVHNN